jgi:hypothetical protein
MGVMDHYMEHGGSGAAWDSMAMIPAPPGTSLGAMAAQGMFAELSSALGLQVLGVYTPWATRSGDTVWEEIKNPDSNIAIWSITDAQVNAVPEITYGSPLPFVAIITKGPMTQAAVAAMWDGTAYGPYETQAVYRQDDAKGVPTIAFLHWGERIDIAELPKQVVKLEAKAAAVNGALLFAAQIPSKGSTTRALPATSSFQDALETQLMTSAPVTVPVIRDYIPPPPPPPVLEARTNLGLPIAVGLGAAALGFVLWRKKR